MANMSAQPAQKFAFDLDMSANASKSMVISQHEYEAQIAEAEQRGYARGLAEGEQSSTARSAELLAQGAQQLSEKAHEALETAQEMHEQRTQDAIELSTVVATKLAANLIVRHPLENIRKLIGECLASLNKAPHLVIQCHEELAEPIKSIAEERIKSSGFEGRLVVMGQPDFEISDVQFEWTDGGIKHDLAAISQQITQKISNFLGPRQRPNPYQEAERKARAEAIAAEKAAKEEAKRAAAEQAELEELAELNGDEAQTEQPDALAVEGQVGDEADVEIEDNGFCLDEFEETASDNASPAQFANETPNAQSTQELNVGADQTDRSEENISQVDTSQDNMEPLDGQS